MTPSEPIPLADLNSPLSASPFVRALLEWRYEPHSRFGVKHVRGYFAVRPRPGPEAGSGFPYFRKKYRWRAHQPPELCGLVQPENPQGGGMREVGSSVVPVRHHRA